MFDSKKDIQNFVFWTQIEYYAEMHSCLNDMFQNP